MPDTVTLLARVATAALPDAPYLQQEIDDRMARIPTRLNAYGYDAWGFHTESTKHALAISTLLYRHWFRVETHGIRNLPQGAACCSNHAGQVALDAAMIGCATFFEAEPPRIIRGMGEYWLPTVPFLSEVMVRTGSVVGVRKNCVDMLEQGECVIAFPEGVRGMNKLIWERYQLQEFGHGFMRLALETDTPIVPIAVVGPRSRRRPSPTSCRSPASWACRRSR
jgi:1-acyl-sn-glycerol-3-phosphate acyltransferase